MNVALIPVRGGSKSIPLKNIKPMAGKPLIYWTVKAACDCRYIDKVYIATDSRQIRGAVDTFRYGSESALFSKAEVVGRSAESATDTASTESVMLEFSVTREFDNVVLIQATSPLLTGEDLDNGFQTFLRADIDSVLSTVRQKRFLWTAYDGHVRPQNYDPAHRPRRQEFEGYLVENGAFYITSRERLLQSKTRISGNIAAVEMDEASYFEIDEPSDWIIIEALLNRRLKKRVDIPEIKMLLTDCDGCLTDGGMYYSEAGDELKKFNTRDGVGFSMLKEHGIITGIITGEDVVLNRRRAEKLGLEIYEPGCKDKLSTVVGLCKKYGITMKEVAYIGDDINDLEVLKRCGLAACPADACETVKRECDYVCRMRGGEGCVREFVDMILDEARAIE